MAVVIRLARQGKKHAPSYRITVADSRRYVTSKSLEVIGTYNPTPGPKGVKLLLNKEAYDSWIKKGAQPSDRVRSLVRASEAKA